MYAKYFTKYVLLKKRSPLIFARMTCIRSTCCHCFVVIILIAVSCEGIVENLCNRSNVRLVDGYLLEQLRAARAEVGLSSDPSQDFNMFEMRRVFRQNIISPCLTISHNSNTTQCFVPILKAAHDSINANMDTMWHRYPHIVQKSVLQGINHSTVVKGNEPHDPNHFRSFTFVRDPFSHFTSGFGEAVFWHWFRARSYVKQHISKQLDGANNASSMWFSYAITQDQAEFILRNFLTFSERGNALYAREHLFPQSGVLFGRDLDVVGNMETFVTDWKEYINPAWAALNYTFNNLLGAHEVTTGASGVYTAQDPQNAHGAIAALIRAKPQYLKAICQFILIDYVCLPYFQLPKECAHLEYRVENGRNLLNSKDDFPVSFSGTGSTSNKKEDATTTTMSSGGVMPTDMLILPQEDRLSSLRVSATAPRYKPHLEQQPSSVNKCYKIFNKNNGQMREVLYRQAQRSIDVLNVTSSRADEGQKDVSVYKIERFLAVPGLLLFTNSSYFTGASMGDIPYVRMVGAGSRAIQSNLFAAISPRSQKEQTELLGGSGGSEGRRSTIAAARYRSITGSYELFQREKLYQFKSRLTGRSLSKKVFTFVRDPLERFKANFVEAIQTYFYFIDVKPATMGHLLEDYFLDKLNVVDFQVYLDTMSGSLFEFDVQVIGKVENLRADWQNKIVPTYGLDPVSAAWDDTYGRRNHSFDSLASHSRRTFISSMNITDSGTNGARSLLLRPSAVPVPAAEDVRAQLDNLLRQTPQLLEAICHHVLIDYLCLDNEYAVPTVECPNMIYYLEEARKFLDR